VTDENKELEGYEVDLARSQSRKNAVARAFRGVLATALPGYGILDAAVFGSAADARMDALHTSIENAVLDLAGVQVAIEAFSTQLAATKAATKASLSWLRSPEAGQVARDLVLIAELEADPRKVRHLASAIAHAAALDSVIERRQVRSLLHLLDRLPSSTIDVLLRVAKLPEERRTFRGGGFRTEMTGVWADTITASINERPIQYQVSIPREHAVRFRAPEETMDLGVTMDLLGAENLVRMKVPPGSRVTPAFDITSLGRLAVRYLTPARVS